MNIGIIGSGRVGSTLARSWLSGGHRVMLSYARQLSTLEAVGGAVGFRRVGGYARTGRSVWRGAPAGRTLPPNPRNRCAVRPVRGQDCAELLQSGDCSQARVSRRAYRRARRQGLLHRGGRPAAGPHATLWPPALLYCGNDALAKQVVARLIRDSGFEPVDAGPLTSARHIEAPTLLHCAIRAAGLRGPFAYDLLRALSAWGWLSSSAH